MDTPSETERAAKPHHVQWLAFWSLIFDEARAQDALAENRASKHGPVAPDDT